MQFEWVVHVSPLTIMLVVTICSASAQDLKLNVAATTC
jgi:hypothetical protein